MLREVQRLSQDEGVNLAGIKRILELETANQALRQRLSEVLDEVEDLRVALSQRRRVFAAGTAGEIVAMAPGRRPAREVAGNALVVWRPPRRS